MKKILTIIFASWSCIAATLAQPVLVSEAVPTPEENSLLWKISGKGLQQSSYLFGTIHMIEEKDFLLTPATREVFNKTGRVVFEINLEEMTNLAMLFSLSRKIYMNNDSTLKQLLTAEEYQLVGNYFSKQRIPMAFVERIKPMFLAATGSTDLMQAGQGKLVSYEMELMDMARDQGKEIAGLESIEYQMSIFDSIPYRVQAQMLVQTIRTGDTNDDQFQQLVERYKAQDLQGLQEMLTSDKSGISEFEDLLLGQRNRNWIPVMEKMMAAKSTFFAVGAGHLGGEQGVIALLRNQGYLVEPLR